MEKKRSVFKALENKEKKSLWSYRTERTGEKEEKPIFPCSIGKGVHMEKRMAKKE